MRCWKVKDQWGSVGSWRRSSRWHWHCVSHWQVALPTSWHTSSFNHSQHTKLLMLLGKEPLNGLHSHMRWFIITEGIWERPASQSVQLEDSTWSGSTLICYRNVLKKNSQSHTNVINKMSWRMKLKTNPCITFYMTRSCSFLEKQLHSFAKWKLLFASTKEKSSVCAMSGERFQWMTLRGLFSLKDCWLTIRSNEKVRWRGNYFEMSSVV